MPAAAVYTVELHPDAWAHVGQVPTATYRRIRDELASRAELAALQPQLGSLGPVGRSSTSFFVVGEFIATYVVDDARRRVELLRIERRSTG